MNRFFKKGIQYLQNQEIDLSTRMLFLLEYAVLFASIVGTAVMAVLSTSILMLIPNFILFICCGLGFYFTYAKKKYNVAAAIIVCGGDYIALTSMFFSSGGNHSGMPVWFLFGVVFTCMMVKGRLKIIMVSLSILIPGSCMLLGHFHPELVRKLANSQAEFADLFQSFIIVSIILCASLLLYLNSYEKQRQMLEQKSSELKKAINTDIITGIANRHAFYEDTVKYIEEGYSENLVLASFDLNGLKTVNDTKGHGAGDELIRSAARILNAAFSKYGSIYRTGGDEFEALLVCSDKEADSLTDEVKIQSEKFNRENASDVSIAAGIAVWNRNRNMNFYELQKLADFSMYQNKKDYYAESRKDRRL